MSNTIYPIKWFKSLRTTSDWSAEICRAAGVSTEDDEIAALLVCDDAEVISACNAAKNPAPACDEDGNLVEGNVYAVCGADGTHCRLVHVHDGGVAVRI